MQPDQTGYNINGQDIMTVFMQQDQMWHFLIGQDIMIWYYILKKKQWSNGE